MIITPLASGSQGNCLLLRAADQVVLVDIGLEWEELEPRLDAAGLRGSEVTAVCVTHRHKDHIRGVASFCKTFKTPVFSSRRTLRSLSNKLNKLMFPLPLEHRYRIGGIELVAVELSHDAPQTVAYRFDDGTHRFGIATDLGCSSPTLSGAFADLDALLLEFNYDPEMLESGPYHRQLRDRVASDRGHLSNGQAAEFLAGIGQSRMQYLWLGHISAKNNTPELAHEAARGALHPEFRGALMTAEQDRVSTSGQLAAT